MTTMMKKILGALMATCLALLLGACGGGGSGGQTAVADDSMVIGVEYVLAASARVVSTGLAPAVIEIRHDLETGLRYVTLLEGSADLLQGA